MLSDVPSLLPLLGGAALVACVLWALLGWLQRRARRTRARARSDRALWGEARARGLLADAGYTVVDAQVRRRWLLSVDGEDFPVDLRVDYLAEKDGARFVAEVKTGAAAPQLSTAATRRQLLEYRVAFDVDGVLLVDAEAGRVQRVVFPGVASLEAPFAGSRPWYLLWLTLASLVALAAWAWLGHR